MYIMPGLDLTLQILGDYPLVCNAYINACKLRSTAHLYVVQDMLKLSDDQIQDLMFVRRVTYLKNHILSCQREAVAAKILEDSPTPVVNVNKLSVSAIQLKQQAQDKHDVVQRAKWAIHCGVRLDLVKCLECLSSKRCIKLILCMPVSHRLGINALQVPQCCGHRCSQHGHWVSFESITV